jgi:phosphohistidine swiveling domain-containing protein
LNQAACSQIQSNIDMLRVKNPHVSFAVRSSALSEDSEKASFAGEFETILDVKTNEDIFKAIYEVYNSRKSNRVQAYSLAKGMVMEHEIAIVVQILVKADISGVLFTADPITGSRMDIAGNFIYGMGEALVSGEATPYSFRIKRPRGSFEGPQEFKRFAGRLYKIAVMLEKTMGVPQDIEWAIAGGKVFLLQSRPVTTLKGDNLFTGEWNDSLTGDYLWSNANLTEATPDIMTPLTWSLLKILHIEAQPFKVPGGYPMVGNLGGHPYVNLSLMVSLLHIFGTDVRKILQKWEEVFGLIPDGIEVPLLPLRIAEVLATIPDNIRWELKVKRLYKELPEFIASNPAWCENIRQEIRNSITNEELTSLWSEKIKPYYLKNCFMLRMVMKKFQEPVFELSQKLKELVGSADANTLLSNLRGDSTLDSLGPVIALSRLANGDLCREAYLKQYGHRGPHELEVSIPGADEDTGWIEQQLEDFRKSPVDIGAMLSNQHKEYDKALKRLQECYPKKFKNIKSQIEEISSAACMREALRSEFTRTNKVVRFFALSAGELSGIKEDIFFLYIEEILELLSGSNHVLNFIDKRKETYKKYCSLPPYPTLVNGRFDVFQWADNPNRRSDIFDSHSPDIQWSTDVINGFAGAAGVVEGIVRRLDNMEEGNLLQTGEILVTVTTNIGWTPLFPRAAAIVTDVGAPLSHAAIVARELGIPAVVGCGNATLLLHTGDRVSVDGGNGVIKILEP